MTTTDYAPIVDPLAAEFGVDFELWDTGGGCTAIQAVLDGDITIVITDCPNTRNGHEAHISSMSYRLEHGEDTVGFHVGVYREDGCDLIIDQMWPNGHADELPSLVRWLVDRAQKNEACREAAGL